jgi:hypothetical protein
LAAARTVGLVEAALETALAVAQLPAYLGFHLKSLGVERGFRAVANHETPENAGGF